MSRHIAVNIDINITMHNIDFMQTVIIITSITVKLIYDKNMIKISSLFSFKSPYDIIFLMLCGK